MKNLLYIGNKLSNHSNNATSIETLGLLFENEGYKLYYASSKKNKLIRLLDMFFKTIQLCKKVDYVLIDVYSTYNFWYAFIISQLCRVLNLKYIPKLHGGNLPNRLLKNPELCKMIFKNAHINIAPSKYLFDSFKNFGFINIMYVPNTIEIQNYEFKTRNTISPKLLWVRSFDKIYNPMMAIKVFIELKKEFPDSTLCMVGPDKDGSLELSKEFAQLNNVDVRFTGKLSKQSWIELSKEYDIFINTTHFDNTPISVIEAMALGLPVVSTNVGGMPFLIENDVNGLLINDDSVGEMIVAIKKLVDNHDFSKLIVLNARQLTEKFDWETVKELWFKILK